MSGDETEKGKNGVVRRRRWWVSTRWDFGFRCRGKSDGLFNLATHCHSFCATLLRLYGRSGRDASSPFSLSPFDLFFRNFHPFASAATAEPMARIEIPAVPEEKQSREDFSVSSPETQRVARRMIYLCFLSSPGLEWNSIGEVCGAELSK